jgi:hypothetical protein
MTDSDIIAAFKAEELRLGSMSHDTAAVIRNVAYERGITTQRVRDVMTAHWTGQGAG